MVQLEEAVNARHHDSPSDRLLGREDWLRYQRALRSLSPDDQRCIQARFEAGLGYEALARVLGRPTPGAARAALNRAAARLEAAMRAQRRLEVARSLARRNRTAAGPRPRRRPS
jgi:DNA-directed RNA polymerase specialized sigma24 family protein